MVEVVCGGHGGGRLCCAGPHAGTEGEWSWNSACSTVRACFRSFRGGEHQRIMDEVAIVEAADRVGFKYTWATEHHFLTEYSHLSANEVFLGYLAAATSRIHLGSGIFNITPPVNHPARVAERVAMLDHLSEGRFEFGMGRGSSTTEQRGFGITDPDLTREMFDEVVAEFRKMWRAEEYPGLRRTVLLDARAQRAPEAVLRAAPADVGRGREPGDLREGRAYGSRRAVLHDGRSGSDQAARRDLQERDPERRAGRRVRERQHHGDDAVALSRGRAAGARARRRPEHGLPREFALPLSRHLSASGGCSRMAGGPARSHARRHRRGRSRRATWRTARPKRSRSRSAGTPMPAWTRSCSGCCRRRMERDIAIETIETFGKHVLPAFDTDPVHRTTRQREAAAQSRSTSAHRIRITIQRLVVRLLDGLPNRLAPSVRLRGHACRRRAAVGSLRPERSLDDDCECAVVDRRARTGAGSQGRQHHVPAAGHRREQSGVATAPADGHAGSVRRGHAINADLRARRAAWCRGVRRFAGAPDVGLRAAHCFRPRPTLHRRGLRGDCAVRLDSLDRARVA